LKKLITKIPLVGLLLVNCLVDQITVGEQAVDGLIGEDFIIDESSVDGLIVDEPIIIKPS